MNLNKELAEIAGSECISADDSALTYYSVDPTIIKTKKADFIVYVKNTEEVHY